MQKCRRSRERTPSNADNMAALGLISTQLVHHQLLQGKGPLEPPPHELDTYVTVDQGE